MTPLRLVGTIAVSAVSLAACVWVVASGVVAPSDAAPTLLIPLLFVIAGLLGSVWHAAPFTAMLLAAVGVLHLLALALSAVALAGASGAAAWHVLSQMLFVAGFGILVPLAAGYPKGPAPRWAWLVVAAGCLVPLLAGLSGPTPAALETLDGEGAPILLGPLAAVLPPAIAGAAGVVFALPIIAVAVAIVRLARGDRELRGRLAVPLIALAGFALIVVAGALLPASAAGVTTALFLVSAPLVPVGLVAGSRPVAMDPDEAARRARLVVIEAQPAAQDGAASSPSLESLTPRERDVLRLMAEGQSNPAIGRSLHISLSAVEKHTTAIFGKLGLTAEPDTHRRVSAVVAYLRASAR